MILNGANLQKLFAQIVLRDIYVRPKNSYKTFYNNNIWVINKLNY